MKRSSHWTGTQQALSNKLTVNTPQHGHVKQKQVKHKTTNTNAYTSTQHTLRCSLRQVLLVSADWRGSLSSLASAALAACPATRAPGHPSTSVASAAIRASLAAHSAALDAWYVRCHCRPPVPWLLASRGLTLTPLQVVSSTCLPGRHLPRPPALAQCPHTAVTAAPPRPRHPGLLGGTRASPLDALAVWYHIRHTPTCPLSRAGARSLLAPSCCCCQRQPPARLPDHTHHHRPPSL